MKAYKITSVRGGISYYENIQSPPGSFKFGSGLDIRKSLDSLSCQQALVDLTFSPGFSDLIIKFVPCSDGNTYGFGNSGKIYRITSALVCSVVYTDPDGAIKGAEEHFDNLGNTYLAWATDTKLKKKPIPGASDWSDVSIIGSSTFATTDVNTGTEEITVGRDIATGTPIQFTTTTGLPSPLAAGTIYYAIRISATVIKVATSVANATAGTAIDLTTQGTGTHTIIVSLTPATYHTMKVIADTLTICNDKFLATIGYTGTYTPNALVLPSDNVTKTLFEYETQSIRMSLAGCTKRTTAKRGSLFLWYLLDSSWGKKKDIPAEGINAIVESEVLLMQAGSKGNLYYSDFRNMLPITSFPGGGKVNPDGVEGDEGLALFGVFGNGTGKTGVYSVGRKKKNGSFVFNLEYALACDEIGSVRNTGGDTLISYKNGATYGVKKVDPNSKAPGIYESIDFARPMTLPADPTLWNSVKLTTKDMPANTAIEVWYRLDKKGTFDKQAKMEGEVAQFISGMDQEALFLIGEKATYLEIQIKLIPSGNNTPEIYLPGEVFFE